MLAKTKTQKENHFTHQETRTMPKKLIERLKSKNFRIKAFVHHIPTDKDINNLFKEFTVDFLLKGT